MRKCNKCKQIKNNTEFYSYIRNEETYHLYPCKECKKQDQRNYNKTHKRNKYIRIEEKQEKRQRPVEATSYSYMNTPIIEEEIEKYWKYEKHYRNWIIIIKREKDWYYYMNIFNKNWNIIKKVLDISIDRLVPEFIYLLNS